MAEAYLQASGDEPLRNAIVDERTEIEVTSCSKSRYVSTMDEWDRDAFLSRGKHRCIDLSSATISGS